MKNMSKIGIGEVVYYIGDFEGDVHEITVTEENIADISMLLDCMYYTSKEEANKWFKVAVDKYEEMVKYGSK